MQLIGKTTIHPFLFYTGKVCGYLTWAFYGLSLAGVPIVPRRAFTAFAETAYVLTLFGLILVTVSLINLGKSTRLGLPDDGTRFKTGGLYRFSRNPMYLGFNLLTVSAAIYMAHPVVMVMGIYSIVIYHFIIRGEERFLEERFGKEYAAYRERVRRYF